MVLVTGVQGQLGFDVARVLKERNMEYVAPTLEELDITDQQKVSEILLRYHPDIVVHCAAYTAVDRAEDEEERCRRINADGTRFIAECCRKIGAKMVYISTDYVFSGIGDKPYEVDDETGPLDVYGRTKMEGEQAVKELLEKYFIVRISWVFGKNGNNFIKTMLRIGKENGVIRVVNDQIGSPTYTADLAELICDMIVTDKYGVYHATNEGFCSWAEFARAIFKYAGYDTEVKDISTEEYGAKASRPLNSRLSKEKLDQNGFERLPFWEEALKRFLKDECVWVRE